MKWIKRLFSDQTKNRNPPRVPSELRVYAVGDIHGRADLLRRMSVLVAEDLRSAPVSKSICILLGDYVDRGAESRAVLDLLSRELFPTQIVALRGNHETMLLTFLTDPDTGGLWRRNGGVETLYSYGVDITGFRRGKDYQKVSEEFRLQLPQDHHQFLRETRLSLTIGDYFFCHAGVRPKIALDLQAEEDLLWIRDEFLDSKSDHGKIIVHGHTPVLSPEVKPNRINIDTGAYVSGRLTALVLEHHSIRFLST